MTGYLIASVFCAAGLAALLAMWAYRVWWTPARTPLDQHLGRHLVLIMTLVGLLCATVPQSIPRHPATTLPPAVVPTPVKNGPLAPADSAHAPYSGYIAKGPNANIFKMRLAFPQSQLTGWYVNPFYSRDTGINIAPLVNAAGDQYHIWPVYLLAVVFAESGGYQYAKHEYAWPDISYGFTQETVQTLGGYGVCNFNIVCARAWEWNATNSIYMGARILHDYMQMTGVGYPALWECYNAGPGSCRSPYYAAFLSNYYTALTYATSAPPPPATPTATPPKKHISWHRAVRLAHPRLGAFTRQHWVPRPHAGFNVYRYRHGVALCWPRYHRCAVRVG